MDSEWADCFDSTSAKPGASPDEIDRLLAGIGAPVSEAEFQGLRQVEGVDPTAWTLPQSLPEAYLDFLRWANGGRFTRGKRVFDPVLSTHQIREFLIAYCFPEWMPGAVPIALDGGGGFYLLDLREASYAANPPVVFADAGDLDWSAALPAGQTLRQAFAARDRPRG